MNASAFHKKNKESFTSQSFLSNNQQNSSGNFSRFNQSYSNQNNNNNNSRVMDLFARVDAL